MNLSGKQQRTVWLTGFSLVLLKVGFLFAYGPLHLPDSGGYTVFADLMLTKSDWLHFIDLKVNYLATIDGFSLYWLSGIYCSDKNDQRPVI